MTTCQYDNILDQHSLWQNRWFLLCIHKNVLTFSLVLSIISVFWDNWNAISSKDIKSETNLHNSENKDTCNKTVCNWRKICRILFEHELNVNHFFLRWLCVCVCVCTCETRRWFSLSQVSLMAALRSNRRASCSSFSWRISSVLRANSRSCSAFSSRSQACRWSRH